MFNTYYNSALVFTGMLVGAAAHILTITDQAIRYSPAKYNLSTVISITAMAMVGGLSTFAILKLNEINSHRHRFFDANQVRRHITESAIRFLESHPIDEKRKPAPAA